VSGQVTPDHWEVDRASGAVQVRRVGAKRAWSVFDPVAEQVVLADLPADLARRACLDDDELGYLCLRAAEIEAAEGVPQDVEWAIATDGGMFFLQHRPETTWTGAPPRAFDPVGYALRNVFKVPGT
jgi:phosphoenolpyruvate synthase/pyruvate phosphate dikinase